MLTQPTPIFITHNRPIDRFKMATPAKLDIHPNVEDARKLFEQTSDAPQKPTLLPICISLPSDLLTPSAIYLKLSAGYVSRLASNPRTQLSSINAD